MLSHGIHTGRIRSFVAAIGLALAAVLVTAAPAAAHDELVSADPASGSTLDALPAQLTLTFSAFIYTEQGATQIEVTDAAGASLTDGEPTVDGAQVIQPLAGTPSGEVTVLWRVVSSDGHPIDGEFAFTVTGTATPAPTETATAEPTPSASEEPTPEATATDATVIATPISAEGGSSAFPWIVGGIILVAVGGAVTYLLVSRSRRERDLRKAREATGAAAYEPPHEH